MNAGRSAIASIETERLLNEIGQLLADATGHPLAGVLLYAQVEDNMVGPATFIERGNHVEYSRTGDSLTYPLLDLWEEEEPGKRWAEMEYLLRNGKFTVTFAYPDEINSDEDFDVHFARRDRIVKRHFGDKPIIYPPMPDDGAQQFDM